MHGICYLLFLPLYRFRMRGVKHIPREGPLLIVANHQSFYDPIIVGLGIHKRPFFAMARKTLWDTKWVAWLIDSLNAVPVDQDASDMKAMRRTLGVLQAGQALMLFPEGARTPDGEVHGFAPGMMLLIRRAKPRVLPVGLDGAYDVWPRGRKRPPAGGADRGELRRTAGPRAAAGDGQRRSARNAAQSGGAGSGGGAASARRGRRRGVKCGAIERICSSIAARAAGVPGRRV